MSRSLQNVSILIIVVIAAISVIIGLFIYLKSEDINEDLIVNVKQGRLKGIELYTLLNHMKYYSFMGIPFAKPPTGALRFKDPLPADPWVGVLDATKTGSACPQAREPGNVIGDEDCLYVNVYTPQFLAEADARYPVLVFIHGGSFLVGSNSPKSFGPDFLIEQNIVVVTVNYRLGALGFLSVLTENAPGNAGLKDQLLALKWINENIHSFGGDPNNITFSGSSAGSAMVHYHILSPLSKGLFHRSIMGSGMLLTTWSLTEQPEQHALRLGRLLGFSGTDVNLLVDFLRTKPASDLIKSQNLNIDPENPKLCLDLPFTPSIEKQGTGNPTFLSVHPRILMESGEFSKVPTMMGTCTNEASAIIEDIFKTVSSYGYEYKRFIPESLGLKNDSTAFQQLSSDIKSFYYHNQSIDVDHIREYIDVCSDVLVNIALNETLTYLANWNVRIHLYMFDYDGRYGTWKSHIKRTRPDFKKLPKGAFHTDDLGYIFRRNQKYYVDSDSADMKMIIQMSSYWANFTKYGDPSGIDKENSIWKPYTQNNIRYLDINKKSTLVNHIFYPERMAFWENAYKKYKKI